MALSDRPHSRVLVRFRELARRMIRFLGGLSGRDFEYDFVYRQVVGEHLQILDVGGCESLLPLLFAQRGHSVTVYDFREYHERHPNLTSIQGDFLANALPAGSFDYVVMVSAIEHVGFGSYGAPTYEDGDLKAMAQIKRVLKPSGSIIVTFPFASKEHHVPGYERWYDLARVQRLFEGMHVLAEEYHIPEQRVLGKVFRWVPAALEQITAHDDVVQRYGCQCNACYTVSLTPRRNFR